MTLNPLPKTEPDSVKSAHSVDLEVAGLWVDTGRGLYILMQAKPPSALPTLLLQTAEIKAPSVLMDIQMR